MARKTRLPPLNALRAFESAANHRSFSRAAEELCVTAAAVSYQVRLLERDLGAALFLRQPRGLALTREGRGLQSVCQKAFADIGEVVEAIKAGSRQQRVRVTALPHFSAHQLFPGRDEFMRSFPQFDFEVDHNLALPRFPEEGYDFAIAFGTGSWPGFESELLFNSPVMPACSPKLLERLPLDRPEDLKRVPILLDDNTFHEMWVDWFRINELAGWEKLNYVNCNDIHALLSSAIAGYGVILEPRCMIEEFLGARTLVLPFAKALTNYGYHLVYPSTSIGTSAGRAFREWILGRTQALRAGAAAAE
ncbi:MAG: LysR substrate-binding domain-containing protein [Hyphomicrobium sp.]|uniref:LysR substrate-binding domain-containing protein n=1 Tax=Hyphomicrobium sp. TaxID=82 RepID=UPI003D14F11D